MFFASGLRIPFATSLVVLLVGGCAGSAADTSKSPTPAPSPSGSSANAPVDAGSEPPFAGSLAEATTMIASAVDSRGTAIGTCVRDFRARRKLLRERVSVSFGIGQDGRLLGVTSKGAEDAELKGCVQNALGNAAFPRSHAGVITVTKTYAEILQ